MLSRDELQSEDCLSLNVYAPTVESEEAAAGVRDKLPVVSLPRQFPENCWSCPLLDVCARRQNLTLSPV